MFGYLKEHKPKTSLRITLALLISFIITLFIDEKINLSLSPDDLTNPLNYYKFFTYPFVINGTQIWFHHFIVIVISAYIIEKHINSTFSYTIAFTSVVIDGLTFTISSKIFGNELLIASPTLITWGFLISSIVTGLFYGQRVIEQKKY